MIFSRRTITLSGLILIWTHTNLYQLSRRVYNYRKADLNDLRRTLECIPWNILGLTDKCEEATSLFHDLVEAALADVVPVVNPRRPSPPWFDGEVRKALKAKEKAFRKKKSDPTTENILLFKTARTAFKHIARRLFILLGCWCRQQPQTLLEFC